MVRREGGSHAALGVWRVEADTPSMSTQVAKLLLARKIEAKGVRKDSQAAVIEDVPCGKLSKFG